MADAPFSTDPLSWQVSPGQTVGDLVTVEQCEEAVRYLDLKADNMLSQIARAEAGEWHPPRGWRSKVHNAQRWTGRVRKAVNVRLRELQAAQPKTPNRQEQRRKAMLAVIYDEVGEEEFARFAKLTEAKRPELFQGGEHADQA